MHFKQDYSHNGFGLMWMGVEFLLHRFKQVHMDRSN